MEDEMLRYNQMLKQIEPVMRSMSNCLKDIVLMSKEILSPKVTGTAEWTKLKVAMTYVVSCEKCFVVACKNHKVDMKPLNSFLENETPNSQNALKSMETLLRFLMNNQLKVLVTSSDAGQRMMRFNYATINSKTKGAIGTDLRDKFEHSCTWAKDFNQSISAFLESYKKKYSMA